MSSDISFSMNGDNKLFFIIENTTYWNEANKKNTDIKAEIIGIDW